MTRPFVSEYAGDAKLENIEMGVNARRQIDEKPVCRSSSSAKTSTAAKNSASRR